MALSVCFLTRNEEKNIARAVRSVAGVADEVIVADTGSADRTAPVAAEAGARVCQVPWDDDFAAGRNYALDQATGVLRRLQSRRPGLDGPPLGLDPLGTMTSVSPIR